VTGAATEERAAGTLPDAAVPFLPRGVRLRWCGVREGWFLLAPERAVKLNPVAAEVLQTLDGRRDFAAVVADLAARFAAPPERIAADARPLLLDLVNRRMVEIRT
jgi:pyrroloquinoline quinone biosynthesis protein D